MDLSFREARREDIPHLIRMLADDPLGRKRERYEDPLPECYYTAFQHIDGDPNHQLILAVIDGSIAGFLQLSFLPNLTYQGGWRALIEGVRVNKSMRGAGIGRQMVDYAVRQARERDCRMVQLTTDKKRPEALAFYESIGFVASHEGMKLTLA